MRSFYLDLAKICFGVGFYGSVAKLESPALTVAIGVFSLVMLVVFVCFGYAQPERSE